MNTLFGIFTVEQWLAILRIGIVLLVAIFLNLNYIILAGVKPKDISVNAVDQCEQGQNYTMIISEITLLATISWTVWSVASVLGWFLISIKDTDKSRRTRKVLEIS